MIIGRHDTQPAFGRNATGMTASPLPGFSPRLSPQLSPRLAAGLLALLVWALLAGSALYWWLRVGELTAPLQAPPAEGPRVAQVDAAQVARALGATQASAEPAPDDVARRLALRGVVTHGGRGAALIAVDGKTALPLRVGDRLQGVEGDWRLRSVARHGATLAAGGRELTLEMPELAQRSTAGDAVASFSAPQPGMAQAAPVLSGGLPRPGSMMGAPAAATEGGAAQPAQSGGSRD